MVIYVELSRTHFKKRIKTSSAYLHACHEVYSDALRVKKEMNIAERSFVMKAEKRCWWYRKKDVDQSISRDNSFLFLFFFGK